MIGMQRIRTTDVIEALQEFVVQHRPYNGYDLSSIHEIHADAGSQFQSDLFHEWAKSDGRNIRVVIAAPEHQHQNGTVERPYQTCKMLANRQLVHARLPNKFYTRSILNSSKIMNYLPHKGVFTNGRTGDPCTPYEAFHSRKPNIQKLRVFGCPCVVKIYHRRSFDKKVLTTKNNFQRGIRGIYVGHPSNQAGWLIFIPSSGHLLVSGDVAFDEHFTSTLDYGHLTFHDALPLRSPGARADPTLPNAHMGPPRVTGFSDYFNDSPSREHIEPFDTFDYEADDTNDHSSLDFTEMVTDDISDIPDEDLSPNERDTPDSLDINEIQEGSDPPNNTQDDDCSYFSDSSELQEGILQDTPNYSAEDGPDLTDKDLFLETLESLDYDTAALDDDELQEGSSPTTYDSSGSSPSPTQPPGPTRRSARIRQRTDNGLYTRMTNSVIHIAASAATSLRELKVASKILKDTVNFPKNVGEPGSDPTYFLPEPRSLADILRLPLQLKNAWIKASIAEIKGLCSRGTFKILEQPPDNIKAPFLMFIWKCKTNQFGGLDKLKARAVFRGDLIPHEDVCTWNPHASWPALKVFLAYASFMRARIRQYDFIQAYLQCSISEPLYCRISKKWIPCTTLLWSNLTI